MEEIKIALQNHTDISGKWIAVETVAQLLRDTITEAASAARNAHELSDEQGISAGAAIIDHFRITQ